MDRLLPTKGLVLFLANMLKEELARAQRKIIAMEIGNLSMRENLALTSAYGRLPLQALVGGGEETQ